MKHLLRNELLIELNKIETVKNIYYKISKSYKTSQKSYCNEARPSAVVYFNGNTRLYISDKDLCLVGFGFRDIPDVQLSPVSGCGDEGRVYFKIDDESCMEKVVNALAQYENIYPIN